MSVKNSIDLDDPLAITGTRVLDAPRELVFAAFTEPKHFEKWWGPDGFTTTTSVFEFRPGGVWRFVMHGPDKRDYQNRITFEVIEPPLRLVYRHGGAADVEPTDHQVTVTFEDLSGKTKLTWRHLFSSAAERNRIIATYGADKGLVQTMSRLADYVAAQQH
ncbi:MAG TPA: SRPBCC family protein [Pseudolabrys sp.]